MIIMLTLGLRDFQKARVAMRGKVELDSVQVVAVGADLIDGNIPLNDNVAPVPGEIANNGEYG